MLGRVVQGTRDRFVGWLRRHGYLDERELEDRSNETPEETVLDGCGRIAFSRGTFARVRGDGSDAEVSFALEHAYEPKRKGRYSVELDGFNIHAAVRVDADDDESRERLARYCARPSIALERLSLLDDGRVAYLLSLVAPC